MCFFCTYFLLLVLFWEDQFSWLWLNYFPQQQTKNNKKKLFYEKFPWFFTILGIAFSSKWLGFIFHLVVKWIFLNTSIFQFFRQILPFFHSFLFSIKSFSNQKCVKIVLDNDRIVKTAIKIYRLRINKKKQRKWFIRNWIN